MKEIKAKIFNKLVDEIRKVKELEEQGYTIDGEKRITDGIGYWYYSPIGEQEITFMSTYDRPNYPFGQWFFVGLTIDGIMVHENTTAVAQSISVMNYKV